MISIKSLLNQYIKDNEMIFSQQTVERIKRSLRGCSFRMSFGLLSFEEGFDLDFFGYLIALPFLDRFHSEPEMGEGLHRWGIYWDEHQSIVVSWKNKSKFFHMPWQWDHHRVEVLRADGTWTPMIREYGVDSYQDQRHIEKFWYKYRLRNGSIQEATATVFVERRSWKWRWFPFLPWPRLVRQSIDVRFDREIGERSGSWKGGCIGCGYDMRPGETAKTTLKRMELERKFN